MTSKSSQKLLRSKLRTLTQSPQEEIEDFSFRITELANEAFSDNAADRGMKEATMLEAFIDGLVYRDIAVKILDDRIINFDVAVREAERLCGNRESANVSRDARDLNLDVLKVSPSFNPAICRPLKQSEYISPNNAGSQQSNNSTHFDSGMLHNQNSAPSPNHAELQPNNSYYNHDNNVHMDSHVDNHVRDSYLHPNSSNIPNIPNHPQAHSPGMYYTDQLQVPPVMTHAGISSDDIGYEMNRSDGSI